MSAMETKKALEQLDHLELQNIIAFYRNRVDAFDQDRQTFYAKLEAIRLKQELVHKNEWELRKRQEEKFALQTALE